MATISAASSALPTVELRSLDPERMRPDDALLRLHMARCAHDGGRWFSLRCMVEAVHQFLAPRFATTLALMLTVVVSVALAA